MINQFLHSKNNVNNFCLTCSLLFSKIRTLSKFITITLIYRNNSNLILSNLFVRSKSENPTNLVRCVPMFYLVTALELFRKVTRLSSLTLTVRNSQTILNDFRFLQDLPCELMVRSKYLTSSYIIAYQFSSKKYFSYGRSYIMSKPL